MMSSSNDSIMAVQDQDKNALDDHNYSVITPKAKNNSKKIEAIYKLQKRLVKKNMHKAMSPISAISGYLELMKMFLQQDVDKERIEKYRSKIEEGVTELSDIIEELHAAFDEQEDQLDDITLEELKKNRRAS